MLKSPYNIDANASFVRAGCVALRTQVDAMFDNLDGTLAGDIDALHDMRVASRRLRAAMSVFASAFPKQQFAPLEREAARLTDALGSVRDADVQIEYLGQLRENAPPAEQVGLDALVDHLDRERERERAVLIKELDRFSSSQFRNDFARMVSKVSRGEGEGSDG
jgi:CHAD domain-containing protein